MLTHALMALAIICSILPLMVQCLTVVSSMDQLDYQVGNIKDLALLQQKTIFASNVIIDDNQFQFDYCDQSYTLKQIDDHLVLTPGAQYFANDVQEVSFYTTNHWIVMELITQQQTHIIGLYHET